MITAEYILKLLDAGGPEAFEEFGFYHDPTVEYEFAAFGILKDIKAYNEAAKNLDATIAAARKTRKE